MVTPLERLWKDTFTVTVRRPFRRENHSTGYEEIVVIDAQPCKVSFSDNISQNSPATPGAAASPLVKSVKLFCSSQWDIPAGSRIDVTHNGATVAYTHSSQPSLFTHHQEILLELFERWA